MKKTKILANDDKIWYSTIKDKMYLILTEFFSKENGNSVLDFYSKDDIDKIYSNYNFFSLRNSNSVINGRRFVRLKIKRSLPITLSLFDAYEYIKELKISIGSKFWFSGILNRGLKRLSCKKDTTLIAFLLSEKLLKINLTTTILTFNIREFFRKIMNQERITKTYFYNILNSLSIEDLSLIESALNEFGLILEEKKDKFLIDASTNDANVKDITKKYLKEFEDMFETVLVNFKDPVKSILPKAKITLTLEKLFLNSGDFENFPLFENFGDYSFFLLTNMLDKKLTPTELISLVVVYFSDEKKDIYRRMIYHTTIGIFTNKIFQVLYWFLNNFKNLENDIKQSFFLLNDTVFDEKLFEKFSRGLKNMFILTNNHISFMFSQKLPRLYIETLIEKYGSIATNKSQQSYCCELNKINYDLLPLLNKSSSFFKISTSNVDEFFFLIVNDIFKLDYSLIFTPKQAQALVLLNPFSDFKTDFETYFNASSIISFRDVKKKKNLDFNPFLLTSTMAKCKDILCQLVLQNKSVNDVLSYLFDNHFNDIKSKLNSDFPAQNFLNFYKEDGFENIGSISNFKSFNDDTYTYDLFITNSDFLTLYAKSNNFVSSVVSPKFKSEWSLVDFLKPLNYSIQNNSYNVELDRDIFTCDCIKYLAFFYEQKILIHKEKYFLLDRNFNLMNSNNGLDFVLNTSSFKTFDYMNNGDIYIPEFLKLKYLELKQQLKKNNEQEILKIQYAEGLSDFDKVLARVKNYLTDFVLEITRQNYISLVTLLSVNLSGIIKSISDINEKNILLDFIRDTLSLKNFIDNDSKPYEFKGTNFSDIKNSLSTFANSYIRTFDIDPKIDEFKKPEPYTPTLKTDLDTDFSDEFDTDELNQCLDILKKADVPKEYIEDNITESHKFQPYHNSIIRHIPENENRVIRVFSVGIQPNFAPDFRENFHDDNLSQKKTSIEFFSRHKEFDEDKETIKNLSQQKAKNLTSNTKLPQIFSYDNDSDDFETTKRNVDKFFINLDKNTNIDKKIKEDLKIQAKSYLESVNPDKKMTIDIPRKKEENIVINSNFLDKPEIVKENNKTDNSILMKLIDSKEMIHLSAKNLNLVNPIISIKKSASFLNGENLNIMIKEKKFDDKINGLQIEINNLQSTLKKNNLEKASFEKDLINYVKKLSEFSNSDFSVLDNLENKTKDLNDFVFSTLEKNSNLYSVLSEILNIMVNSLIRYKSLKTEQMTLFLEKQMVGLSNNDVVSYDFSKDIEFSNMQISLNSKIQELDYLKNNISNIIKNIPTSDFKGEFNDSNELINSVSNIIIDYNENVNSNVLLNAEIVNLTNNISSLKLELQSLNFSNTNMNNQLQNEFSEKLKNILFDIIKELKFSTTATSPVNLKSEIINNVKIRENLFQNKIDELTNAKNNLEISLNDLASSKEILLNKLADSLEISKTGENDIIFNVVNLKQAYKNLNRINTEFNVSLKERELENSNLESLNFGYSQKIKELEADIKKNLDSKILFDSFLKNSLSKILADSDASEYYSIESKLTEISVLFTNLSFNLSSIKESKNKLELEFSKLEAELDSLKKSRLSEFEDYTTLMNNFSDLSNFTQIFNNPTIKNLAKKIFELSSTNKALIQNLNNDISFQKKQIQQNLLDISVQKQNLIETELKLSSLEKESSNQINSLKNESEKLLNDKDAVIKNLQENITDFCNILLNQLNLDFKLTSLDSFNLASTKISKALSNLSFSLFNKENQLKEKLNILESNSKDIEKLGDQFNSLSIKLSSLESENLSLKSEKKELTNKLKNLTGDYVKINESRALLESQLSELDSLNKKLNSNLEKTHNENSKDNMAKIFVFNELINLITELSTFGIYLKSSSIDLTDFSNMSENEFGYFSQFLNFHKLNLNNNYLTKASFNLIKNLDDLKKDDSLVYKGDINISDLENKLNELSNFFNNMTTFRPDNTIATYNIVLNNFYSIIKSGKALNFFAKFKNNQTNELVKFIESLKNDKQKLDLVNNNLKSFQKLAFPTLNNDLFEYLISFDGSDNAVNYLMSNLKKFEKTKEYYNLTFDNTLESINFKKIISSDKTVTYYTLPNDPFLISCLITCLEKLGVMSDQGKIYQGERLNFDFETCLNLIIENDKCLFSNLMYPKDNIKYISFFKDTISLNDFILNFLNREQYANKKLNNNDFQKILDLQGAILKSVKTGENNFLNKNFEGLLVNQASNIELNKKEFSNLTFDIMVSKIKTIFNISNDVVINTKKKLLDLMMLNLSSNFKIDDNDKNYVSHILFYLLKDNNKGPKLTLNFVYSYNDMCDDINNCGLNLYDLTKENKIEILNRINSFETSADNLFQIFFYYLKYFSSSISNQAGGFSNDLTLKEKIIKEYEFEISKYKKINSELDDKNKANLVELNDLKLKLQKLVIEANGFSFSLNENNKQLILKLISSFKNDLSEIEISNFKTNNKITQKIVEFVFSNLENLYNVGNLDRSIFKNLPKNLKDLLTEIFCSLTPNTLIARNYFMLLNFSVDGDDLNSFLNNNSNVRLLSRILNLNEIDKKNLSRIISDNFEVLYGFRSTLSEKIANLKEKLSKANNEINNYKSQIANYKKLLDDSENKINQELNPKIQELENLLNDSNQSLKNNHTLIHQLQKENTQLNFLNKIKDNEINDLKLEISQLKEKAIQSDINIGVLKKDVELSLNKINHLENLIALLEKTNAELNLKIEYLQNEIFELKSDLTTVKKERDYLLEKINLGLASGLDDLDDNLSELKKKLFEKELLIRKLESELSKLQKKLDSYLEDIGKKEKEISNLNEINNLLKAKLDESEKNLIKQKNLNELLGKKSLAELNKNSNNLKNKLINFSENVLKVIKTEELIVPQRKKAVNTIQKSLDLFIEKKNFSNNKIGPIRDSAINLNINPKNNFFKKNNVKPIGLEQKNVLSTIQNTLNFSIKNEAFNINKVNLDLNSDINLNIIPNKEKNKVLSSIEKAYDFSIQNEAFNINKVKSDLNPKNDFLAKNTVKPIEDNKNKFKLDENKVPKNNINWELLVDISENSKNDLSINIVKKKELPIPNRFKDSLGLFKVNFLFSIFNPLKNSESFIVSNNKDKEVLLVYTPSLKIYRDSRELILKNVLFDYVYTKYNVVFVFTEKKFDIFENFFDFNSNFTLTKKLVDSLLKCNYIIKNNIIYSDE